MSFPAAYDPIMNAPFHRWEGRVVSPASDPLPLWDEFTAVDSISEKEYRILHRGPCGSETFPCCPPWWSGIRMWSRIGQQGAGFAAWDTKVEGRVAMCLVVALWGSTQQLNLLARMFYKEDCSSSSSLWFSAEFLSLILHSCQFGEPGIFLQ